MKVQLFLGLTLLATGVRSMASISKDQISSGVISGVREMVDDGQSLQGCTSPFMAVADLCLYFVTFADLNQQEARQMCHSLNAELTNVQTATQLYHIIHYINNNGLDGSHYWLDGSDQATEGDWRDSFGQPIIMGTPLWKASIGEQEPNNGYDDQNCQVLHASYSYYMDDVQCETLRRPLCQQSSSSNSSVSVPKVDCPTFFVNVGGQCLAFMTWADQTWSEARQSCHGLAGELAAVNDIEVLRAIYLYVHQEGISHHSFWLGGSDAATEGVWTWTDGSSVPSGSPFWGYSGSSVLEPGGGTAENCLLLNAEGFHYFRDDECNLLMNPLCQYNFQ